MENQINIVATIRIIFSVIGFLIGIIGFVVLQIIGGISGDHDAHFVLSIIGTVALIFFVVLSIPGFLAGLGLLKRKEWARILTIIISVLDLFNFPIGTAVGTYSLVVLTNSDVTRAFKQKQS
ncbi:MAG: hypothetical protein JXR31_11985 [Prolixibacteraceae bacterium]|nr:hypothetical protein [Prolixibacteraceae bacterium]MBN2774965.1 hypothetical protein [Prolixibacteraceae bacterium]